jgi:hypothetical protein
MGRIPVVNAFGDFPADLGVPLVAEMDQISGQMILLRFRQLCYLRHNLFHAHVQKVSGLDDEASGSSSWRLGV